MFVHDENKFYYQFKYLVSSTTRQVINDEVPWRHDILQNDTQHIDTLQNDTQHIDTLQIDTQHNDTLQIDTQHNDTLQIDTQYNVAL